MAETILVVDDDEAVGSVIAALLTQAGHVAVVVRSAHSALQHLAKKPVDAVLLDLRMPGMDGLELLSELMKSTPDIPVVMMSAHGTVSSAVEAMKKGARDFIQKPIDRDELLFTLKKAMALSERELPPQSTASATGFVGSSEEMKEATELIRKAARGNATVLVRGESGTGKELAARAVHEQSARAKGPFIKVHCAALPDNLLESELFGYEKGAFTGAVARKPGRVELAEGGTLFLDEIGDVTPAVQVKLLRLLQDKAYERLGGTQTLNADVRFVAATHQPLEQLIAEGKFREDLFYRLNVVPVFLPALRARTSDIDALARAFVQTHGAANGRPKASLTTGALKLLTAQSWPGNVRQLQNFIERLVVLSDSDELGEGDVERELSRAGLASAPTASGATSTALEGRVKETERAALLDALSRAKGSRTTAARMLGIARRTLYNKLREHGIE